LSPNSPNSVVAIASRAPPKQAISDDSAFQQLRVVANGSQWSHGIAK
jgi:hypothetical protein